MNCRLGKCERMFTLPKKEPPPKKTKQKRTDPVREQHDELVKANKRIKQLEQALSSTQEELDILKKAQRFFEIKRR